MQRFGEKLHALRKQRGLSLRKLASLLDVKAHSHIDDIEKGRGKPSVELVVRIAEFFDIPTDLLLKDYLELDD